MLTSMILSACGGTTATNTPVPAPTATTAAAVAVPTATAATAVLTPTTAITTGSVVTATTPTAGATSATTSTVVPSTPVVVGQAGSKGVIKIAVDLPTSGADASDGIPTRNGVQLAIEQANAAGEIIPGYNLQMYALDDAVNGKHDPQQGAANVDQYIADDAIVAMVGPFNSNVAIAEMPKLNQANLANISPANTFENLTKPQYGKLGTYRPTGIVTYFRVITTDDIQGPEGADYAYNTLKWNTAYVLDDQEAYGQGISGNFVKEFVKDRGTVVGGWSQGIPGNTTDYASILDVIAAAKPDGVYYGGTTSNGIGLFRKQMKDKLPGMTLFGDDGIVEQQFLTDGGDNANGAYGTVAAVDATKLPEAKTFIDAYNARFNAPLGSYSANAYDAANIIIQAIKQAGANWSSDVNANREAVRANIAATQNYHGAIGITSFDANGDTTNKIISINEVVNNVWTVVAQARFGQ
jgi:branched-chain amino acid transport system substrate-binding protein